MDFDASEPSVQDVFLGPRGKVPSVLLICRRQCVVHSPNSSVNVCSNCLHVPRSGMSAQDSVQVAEDKTVDGSGRMLRYVATQWPKLVLSIMESALSPEHLDDIVWNVEETELLLSVHFRHAVATVRRLWEFQLLYQVFPWRFFMVLDADERLAQQTMNDMKQEWEFLIRQEEKTMNASKIFPLKEVPFLRWRVYREVMTFCEERGWKITKDVKALISSWQANPSSTLGCEDAFRHLRLGERRHGAGEAAPSQLQR